MYISALEQRRQVSQLYTSTNACFSYLLLLLRWLSSDPHPHPHTHPHARRYGMERSIVREARHRQMYIMTEPGTTLYELAKGVVDLQGATPHQIAAMGLAQLNLLQSG